MAVPLQYQSQFIPTNFGAVENILGMYKQDMGQREQEFDQGLDLETSSLADIGSIPTYDLQGRESRMSELDRAISDTVSKYGGDYGAASKDIARIIAKERNNPWYQINKQLYDTEQKRRELALDANNIILGDRYTTVADARKALAEGKDPYTVSALSKKDVFNTGEKIFSNFSDLILKDPTIRSTLGGQYWEQFTQRGYRPEDLDAFLSTGEGAQIMNSFVSTHPQLQGASEQQVREILKQSAYSAIGKEERNMYQNQGYVSPYESFRMRGQEQQYSGSPNILTPSGTALLPSSLSDLSSRIYKNKADKLAKEEAKRLGIPNINSFEDLQKLQQEAGLKEGYTGQGSLNPFTAEYIEPKSENYTKANQALSNIDKIIKKDPKGLALPAYSINTLSMANGKDMRENIAIRNDFESEVSRMREQFSGIDNKTQKDFEKIEGDFKINSISPNFSKDETGIILHISGKDDKKKSVNTIIQLNPKQFDTEATLVSFLHQLNPTMSKEYWYAKEGENYISQLQEKLPFMSPQEQINTLNFIKTKKEQQ